MEAYLEQLFSGKKIALIGPSRCIIGAHQGDEIEAYDLIVRLNHQWPIATFHEKDLGKRMDVLFHCCNPDFPVMRFACHGFKDTKIVFCEKGVQTALMSTICQDFAVPSIDITWQYTLINEQLNTKVNTGLAAIIYLLSLPISVLKLFGLTFFQEPYYEGYLGFGAQRQYWRVGAPPKQIWQHNIDVQFNYFLTNSCRDPRLLIDEHSRRIMRIDDSLYPLS